MHAWGDAYHNHLFSLFRRANGMKAKLWSEFSRAPFAREKIAKIFQRTQVVSCVKAAIRWEFTKKISKVFLSLFCFYFTFAGEKVPTDKDGLSILKQFPKNVHKCWNFCISNRARLFPPFIISISLNGTVRLSHKFYYILYRVV